MMSRTTETVIDAIGRAILAFGPLIEGHLSTRMLAGMAAILGGVGMFFGLGPEPAEGSASLQQVIAAALALWGYVNNRARRDEVGAR